MRSFFVLTPNDLGLTYEENQFLLQYFDLGEREQKHIQISLNIFEEIAASKDEDEELEMFNSIIQKIKETINNQLSEDDDFLILFDW